MFFQLLCLTFALVFSRSASQNMTAKSTTCISANTKVTLSCHTTDFAGSILFYLNGINKGGCVSSTCMTGIAGYVQPTQSGGLTDMVISAYDHSRDGGSWTCSYGALTSSPYILALGFCNSLCVGIRDAVAALSIPSGCSEGARVVICIIIYCLCTQKVTITATADKNTKLKSAEQIIIKGKQQSANLISANRMLGKGKPEQIPIIQNKKCSIVALGGESHECIFETDAGVLTLTFKIKDDLLNVIPGQTIYLPTLLTVDPKYSTIQWDHNGRGFQNDSLYFTTKVTRSKYGVYNIKMKFEDLGLTILIENMRVRGVYWILIVISVPINVLCGVIGVAITGNFRSTDGYCISEIPIVILAVLCGIVNGFLIVVLVYNLFKRRTGNEKNSRPKPANDVTTPPTPSTTSTVSPTIVTSASVTSAKAPSAVETTYSTSGTSPSAVITAYSTDQDRRNQKPSNLPDGYDPQISLRNISGNDQMLKENAEQKNLLDRKL